MDTGEFLIRYLGSFIFAIAVIYALYFCLKKNPKLLTPNLLTLTGKRLPFKQSLQIESVLTLEARKNLYVVRAGNERFLLATSMEGTQFLSKLEASTETVNETVGETVSSPNSGSESVTAAPDRAEDTTENKGGYDAWLRGVSFKLFEATRRLGEARIGKEA